MRWEGFSRLIPILGATALMISGLYQLTPWKQTCLQHCRDPLLLLSHHRGKGWRGAAHLGGSHGLFCLSCCWGLMLVQLVQGVMSVRVMAVVAAIIALEKLSAHGYWLSRIFGGAILGAGIYAFLEAAGRGTY